MTMIKSEVVKNSDEGIEVNVTIEGTGEDLYTEIRAILDGFDRNPKLAFILVQAMTKLVEKLEGK
jgi:hypothetical protein